MNKTMLQQELDRQEIIIPVYYYIDEGKKIGRAHV